MLRVSLIVLLSSSLSCANSNGGGEPTILQEVSCVRDGASGFGTEAWEDVISDYERADAQDPPKAGRIVFTGSSSIWFWETLEEDMAPTAVLNRGFGGSVIAEVTHFADRIVLPYEPRAVVLYAGDNDIAFGLSPDCALRDFEAFVAKIHETVPDIAIYYISIKPSLAREALWHQMQRTNALIEARTSTNPRLHYIDVSAAMLDEEGRPIESLFVGDGLHMNEAGYAIWTAIISPVLVRDFP